MISVEFMPLGEHSPLPNGQRICVFITFKEFKDWVQDYVCVYCLLDFYQFYDKRPVTLYDWLAMGCGCEIEIEDPNYIIDWDVEMKLPDNFDEKIGEYCMSDDSTVLNIGDIIYIVESKNNVFNRKKEQMIIDGEIWYRYDRPNFEYTIRGATIIGKFIPTIEGKWPNNEDGIMDQNVRYHYAFDDKDFGDILYEDEICIDGNLEIHQQPIFTTRKCAEEYVERMKDKTEQ